jgi:hypothetical protein
MGRRIAIFVVLLLGLALAALFVFRTAIVELVIADRLAARGVVVGALEVAEIGLGETRIEGLRLGARDELAAREVRIAYEPGALTRGRIEQISVEGLVLKLDLTGAAPPLGSLQPLIEVREGNAAVPLITTVLTDSRIEAETPLGRVTAALDGEAWSEAPGAAAGAFSFALQAAPGRLQGAFDVIRAADGTAIGKLVIEDGALALPGAEIGGLRGEAVYHLFPDRLPAIDAKLSVERIALPKAAFEEAHLTLRTADTRATLAARISGADPRWSLALAGTLDDYLGAPEAHFDLSALATAGAALWPLLALPEPSAGRAAARLAANGRLAPLMELGAGGSTPAQWLARAVLDGHLVAELTGLAYPGHAEEVSGDLRIDGTIEDGAVTFRLPREGRLHVNGLDPDWLREIGLPDAVIPLLEQGATLTLDGRGRASEPELTASFTAQVSARNGGQVETASRIRLGFAEGFALEDLALDDLRLAARAILLPGLHLHELRVKGALAGAPSALAGELDVTVAAQDIALDDLRAARATAALPISARIAPSTASLELRDGGRVTLEALQYGQALRSNAALRADVRKASVALARNPEGGVSLRHEAMLTVEPLPLVLAHKEGDVTVRVAPGPIAIAGTWSPDAPTRTTARLASTTLVLPDQEIAAEGLAGTFDLGRPPDRIRAEVAVGAVKHRAAAPLFTPLAVTGTLRGDQALAFSVEARGPSGAARLRIAGTHHVPAGRGEARIELDPLAFDPEGLQPGALAPPLAGLRDVSGGLQADATLAWAPGEMNGAAHLRLDNLSFDSDEAAVQGLDLDLRLDRLFPSGSPAGQRLTVRRIDPGVALDDIDVRFQVWPGAPTRLAIERAALSVSGGRLLLRDLLVDPAAERQDVPLEVEGLDLAELFRILDVEGLSGTGRLSGKIPIAMVGETVIIEAGRLEAEAPSRLRFHSEQAAQALAGAGESADLMLRVLQNFHYDELSLAIDKPPETDVRLALVLLGKNPDVLEGHPFRFNINLEGDTGHLVEALSQAYILSNRMLRRAWRPGQ